MSILGLPITIWFFIILTIIFVIIPFIDFIMTYTKEKEKGGEK